MRLNKLSKELSVTAAEIVKTLKKEKGVEIENSPNLKLDEEIVNWLKEKYSPETTVVVVANNMETTAPEPKPSTQKKKEDKNEAVEAIVNEDILVADGKVSGEVPTLDGPKVVGKIELPPPIVRKSAVKEEKEDETKRPARPKRRKTRKKRSDRTENKFVTAEEQREKEIARAVKERELKKKAIKEKRRKEYLEKTKEIQSKETKPKVRRKKADKVEVRIASEATTTSKSVEPGKGQKKEATSMLGKLWKWIYYAD